jgi:hypothetical protein
MRLTKDRTIGIILIVLGLIFIFLTSQIPEPKFFTDTVGPDLFPYIASIGLVLCGVGQLIRSRRKEEKFLTKAGWFRVLKMSTLVIAFPFLLHFVGIIVASFILLLGMAWMFDIEKKSSLLKKIIYAAVLTAIIYAVFQLILKIQLPSGLLVEWLEDLR